MITTTKIYSKEVFDQTESVQDTDKETMTEENKVDEEGFTTEYVTNEHYDGIDKDSTTLSYTDLEEENYAPEGHDKETYEYINLLDDELKITKKINLTSNTDLEEEVDVSTMKTLDNDPTSEKNYSSEETEGEKEVETTTKSIILKHEMTTHPISHTTDTYINYEGIVKDLTTLSNANFEAETYSDEIHEEEYYENIDMLNVEYERPKRIDLKVIQIGNTDFKGEVNASTMKNLESKTTTELEERSHSYEVSNTKSEKGETREKNNKTNSRKSTRDNYPDIEMHSPDNITTQENQSPTLKEEMVVRYETILDNTGISDGTDSEEESYSLEVFQPNKKVTELPEDNKSYEFFEDIIMLNDDEDEYETTVPRYTEKDYFTETVGIHTGEQQKGMETYENYQLTKSNSNEILDVYSDDTTQDIAHSYNEDTIK